MNPIPRNSSALLATAALATAVLASAAGAQGTIQDGTAKFELIAGLAGERLTPDAGQVAFSADNGTTNHFDQYWWWFRVESLNPREYALSNLVSQTYAGDTAILKFEELADGFTAQVEYVVTQIGANQANVTSTIEIENVSPDPIGITLYSYADPNVSSTDSNDTAIQLSGPPSARLQYRDGGGNDFAQFLGTNVSRWENDVHPATVNSLADAAITTFANGVTPLGPADNASAMEHSNTTIPAGGTATFRSAISINTPAFVSTDDDCEPEAMLEFSLDIGSDQEISDPNFSGDERFDPGDAYFWHSAGLPACGADGFRDDVAIFGFDYIPDAPDCAGVTGAPTCSGLDPFEVFFDFFDMDAHDNLDFNLVQFINPDGPNSAPIPFFPAECVYNASDLTLSFDDDGPLHYAPSPCSVPSVQPAASGATYGTSSGQDEIFNFSLINPAVPGVIFNSFPLSDEKSLHPNLRPNPDGTEEFDDDVDSLDTYALSNTTCEFWYFSPDHEATGSGPAGGPLDPGSIYLAAPGGPVRIIDEATHLGIEEQTDLDAFEFVWVEDPQFPGTRILALLFSVDQDDPATPNTDESGGLDPNQIYASYFMGFSFDFLDEPLFDDIDAIANYCTEIGDEPPTGCDGDANGDGVVDVNDISFVIFRLGNSGAPCIPGDANGDGVVDVNDISYVIFRLGTCNPGGPCP